MLLGLLVNDCVLMGTYMHMNPCEYDMFTNRKKAFINFNYFENERALSFTTLICHQVRKRIRTDHEFTLIR